MRSLDGVKDPRAPLQLQSMLTAAGLVNVESQMIPLPLCGWSNCTLKRAHKKLYTHHGSQMGL